MACVSWLRCAGAGGIRNGTPVKGRWGGCGIRTSLGFEKNDLALDREKIIAAGPIPPPAGNGSPIPPIPPGRRGTGLRQKDDGGSRDVGAEKIIAAGPAGEERDSDQRTMGWG